MMTLKKISHDAQYTTRSGNAQSPRLAGVLAARRLNRRHYLWYALLMMTHGTPA